MADGPSSTTVSGTAGPVQVPYGVFVMVMYTWPQPGSMDRSHPCEVSPGYMGALAFIPTDHVAYCGVP